MRATSPSGQEIYEGRVGWSGELGFGVREPERGQSAQPALPAPEDTPQKNEKKRS
jgi:NADH-quinone oxidoreductase subunit I